MELNKCTNWDEKLDTFIAHVPSSYTHLSIDNNKSLCTTIYKRLIAVYKYDVTQFSKLESPIVLLKPTIQALPSAQEDYGLHKVIFDNYKIIAYTEELFYNLIIFRLLTEMLKYII